MDSSEDILAFPSKLSSAASQTRSLSWLETGKHASLPSTRFLSALRREAGPNMSDMSSKAETMFSLSDTPVDSQFLSGGGECIKQHPKQILTNQVEKKLELQHKYPKTW